MTHEFDKTNERDWINALHKTFGKTILSSMKWDKHDEIIHVLSSFMGENLNHTLLPDGGGTDVKEIKYANEPNCLEFRDDFVFKPGDLYFEYIESSPIDSFFLLETKELAQSGIYETLDTYFEELVEIEPGKYTKRSCWDIGYYVDSNGNILSIPSSSRVICRYLKGNFLIVAKTSKWNKDVSTYDGRHNTMSSKQIMQIIKKEYLQL